MKIDIKGIKNIILRAIEEKDWGNFRRITRDEKKYLKIFQI